MPRAAVLIKDKSDVQREVGWRGSGSVEEGDRISTHLFRFCERSRIAPGKD